MSIRHLRRAPFALAVALMLSLGAAMPAVAQDPEPTVLDRVISRIEALVPGFGAAGTVAVTVIRLDTNQRASLHGDELVKSASVVKPLWVAAALKRRTIEEMAGNAIGALYASSNNAAGRVIDAAGGLDRVNRYARELGLANTVAYEWNFDFNRKSRLYPGPLHGNNTTTTDDLARFWELTAIGWSVQGDERDALLGWSQGFKEEGDGQRIIARLPEAVGEGSSFKMGWLPTGREYVLQEGEVGPNGEQPGETIILDYNSIDIGAGIIRVPGGPTYTIAVAAYDGRSWPAMTGWVEYVSCVVYSTLAADPVDCIRGSDPVAIQERRAVPSGRLEAVGLAPGLVTVSGWAMDPDAWWGPSPVAITIDGVEVGTGSAVPTGIDDLFAPRFYRTLLVDLAPRAHEVCVIAVNDGNGAGTPIGCRTLAV